MPTGAELEVPIESPTTPLLRDYLRTLTYTIPVEHSTRALLCIYVHTGKESTLPTFGARIVRCMARDFRVCRLASEAFPPSFSPWLACLLGNPIIRY